MPNYRQKNRNKRNKIRNKNQQQQQNDQQSKIKQQDQQQQQHQQQCKKNQLHVSDDGELVQQQPQQQQQQQHQLLGNAPIIPATQSSYDDDLITARITPPTDDAPATLNKSNHQHHHQHRCSTPPESLTVAATTANASIGSERIAAEITTETTTTTNALPTGAVSSDTVSDGTATKIERSLSSNCRSDSSLKENIDVKVSSSKMGTSNSKELPEEDASNQPANQIKPTTSCDDSGSEMRTISITRQQGKVIVHRVIQEGSEGEEAENSSINSQLDESDPMVIVHAAAEDKNDNVKVDDKQSTEQAKIFIHDIVKDDHHQQQQQQQEAENVHKLISSQLEPKVIVHKIVQQAYRVESPQPIIPAAAEKRLGNRKKSRSLDDDEECSALQIQEISDNSSGNETDNAPPLVSEAESETEQLSALSADEDDEDSAKVISIQTLPIDDEENEEDVRKSVSENYKQRRAQKRIAIESHFLPQFLSPRYLDSITEENSEMSDARSETSMDRHHSKSSGGGTFDELEEEYEAKRKKANAIFPRSNLDFSKKHKHGQLPKAPTTLPTIIREETVPAVMMVEAKIVEQPPISESCTAWSSGLTPESEAAEIVYINSASSSASDLLDLDYEENAAATDAETQRNTIDLDTDVMQILANSTKKTQVDVDSNSSIAYDDRDDDRESTPVNQISTPPEEVNTEQQPINGAMSTTTKTTTTTATTTKLTKLTNEHTVKQFKSVKANNNEQFVEETKRRNTSPALTVDDDINASSSGNNRATESSCEISQISSNQNKFANSLSSCTLNANPNVESSTESEVLLNLEMNDIRDILIDNANKNKSALSVSVDNAATPRRVAPPPPAPPVKGDYSFHEIPSPASPPPPIPPPPATYAINQQYDTINEMVTTPNFHIGEPISAHIFSKTTDTHTSIPTQQHQTSTVCSPKSSYSSLARQESADSHCSDSTTHSQCTAINMGSLPHSDWQDFDAESSVSGGNSGAPEPTDDSIAGDHSNLDTSDTESTICSNEGKESAIKKLRLLCTETLASLPYGEDILEELANVAQNIGEVRAAKSVAVQGSTMPYPLPDLPHITDIRVSIDGGLTKKPDNVFFTQIPPKLRSPSPPPVPAPPAASWVGLPTEANPKLLVCLSPAQQSYLQQETSSVSQPDHLLDAHKKFVERRGYHELTTEQVQAINREKAAEHKIIETAVMMKKLRKSLTPPPPPIPPPPVPTKSAKPRKHQQHQHHIVESSDNFGTANEQQRSLFVGGEEDEKKHRLLEIIHDDVSNEVKQNQNQTQPSAAAVAAAASSHENNSRQTTTFGGDSSKNLQNSTQETEETKTLIDSDARTTKVLTEKVESTIENSKHFAKSDISNKRFEQNVAPHNETTKETANISQPQTNSFTNVNFPEKDLSKMQSIHSEFSKMFPTMEHTDIFDPNRKRFSNIETSTRTPFCSQILSTQPKRYSTIETSTYETKKKIENGHVVYDTADSRRESFIDGEKPEQSFPANEATESSQSLRWPQTVDNSSSSGKQTAAVSNVDEIMSALNLNTASASATTADSAVAIERKLVPPTHHEDDSVRFTTTHSTKTETERRKAEQNEECIEEYINRQQQELQKQQEQQQKQHQEQQQQRQHVDSTDSTLNKNITSAYEEFRQRAKAAAAAAEATIPSILKTTLTPNNEPKTSIHFEHDKLFKEFDDLSRQLNIELESSKANKEKRLKSASLYDLSRMQSESKTRFEELKRERHNHMLELEREIERSQQSRQFKPSNDSLRRQSLPRTFNIPIQIENGNNIHQAPASAPVLEDHRTIEIPVQVEPGYHVTSPISPAAPPKHYNDQTQFRRAESMFNLPHDQQSHHQQHIDNSVQQQQHYDSDWNRYASDFGSSENIARPFAREVEICNKRCKPNLIRAPRMTVSTNDLTMSNNSDHSYDSYNAYNVRRTHAPMLSQVPQKSKPQYLSCQSMIERDPHPTYISTTSRRGVSPALPTSPPAAVFPSAVSHKPLHEQRRASLPREIHEQQLKYITDKEQQLKSEFERLENERYRLLEEMQRAPIMQPPPRTARDLYRPPTKLPTLSEDEVFRQQMAEEWLSKVAEREERRLQKIIKISKIHDEASAGHSVQIQPPCPKVDIGDEFLNRVRERRSKLAMPSDSDWESGAESHPVGGHGQTSENEELPVKVMEGKSETDLRQLPKHLREFAKFSNKEREELGDGHVEKHEEQERRHEVNDNSISSAVKKSSIVKSYKVLRYPGGGNSQHLFGEKTAAEPAPPPKPMRVSSSKVEDASKQEDVRHKRSAIKTLTQQEQHHQHSAHFSNPNSTKNLTLPLITANNRKERCNRDHQTGALSANIEQQQQNYANTAVVKRQKRTRFLLTPNRRSWSESDLLKEIDNELQLAKGFLFADEPVHSSAMFAPKFKANASSGSGIWTPKNQTPSSSKTNLSEEIGTPVIPVPPSLPVWTPQPSSEANGRKEFRPVRFESPTLPRRYVLQQNSLNANVQPPWSYSANPIQNHSQQTPTPPRSANSCTNLSTPNTTVSSSTIYCDSSHCDDLNYASSLDNIPVPSASVSEKIKTFERSASASELHRPRARRQLNAGPAAYRPNEVIYKLKNEYMSEPETGNDRPRKMAQLGRRQYDGIGPVTNDGMPIILRSEVKEPHQHEWYKRLYQTIHKLKNGDDYVIRYKSPRGRYQQYKSNGYVSEPEPNYDSDYSTVKYRTLDPRRLYTSSSAANVRNTGYTRQDDAFYGTMPNPIQSGQSSYKNQPGRIEDYTTGHSSVSEKEKKEWWDEVMDIFNGQHLEQTKLSPHYTEGNLSRALAKESGYASDSNVIFRKKELPPSSALSPVERKEAYKSLQAGGEPPLFGFRKSAPEKPREYVKEFEYTQITPTLTKIRVHNRDFIQNIQHNTNNVVPDVQKKLISSTPSSKEIKTSSIAVCNSEMFNPFSKTMPSFISINQQTTDSNLPPPTPPNRKSSRTRTTLKVEVTKRPTSASSGRHEQCFQAPKSPTLNKFATFTVRKNVRREPLCRSKSAGAVTTLLLARAKGSERSSGSKDIERVSRAQQVLRLNSMSPTRHGQSQSRVAALRHSSRSPVAFGRSISKERTFAEEKKRLENTLPVGRTNFEASTNILRDPSLKSPDEVKQAVRSYATCPTHSRSKSLSRAISPIRYPNFSVSTTTRHSMCLPQLPEAKHFAIGNKDTPPLQTRVSSSKSVISKSKNIKPTERRSSPAKIIPKSFSTASIARTSSTFSVDSTVPKPLSSVAKSNLLSSASKSLRSSLKECTKAVRRSASRPSANALSGGNKSDSNRTKASVAVPTKSQKEVKQNGQLAPSKQIYSSYYYRETSPTPDVADGEISLPTSVHEKTRFWNAYNENLSQSTSLVDQKYLTFNQSRSLSPNYECSPGGFLSHEYLEDMSYVDAEEGSEFGGGTEDLVWRIEQRSKKDKANAKAPQQVSDIARPESPSPSRIKREFSPTREIRIPQTLPREVRSPSRRRIDSHRPSNKLNANNIVRASSLSSADDRSKRGLYLCGELAHSATSLTSTERHSPTCRYRSNSERFNDLNRFYSTLERVGQLERATSDTTLKPIRRDGDSLEFEEWRKLRHHERAEKELSYLVEKLKQDQREKDFVFRPKDVDDVKWNEDKDYGLRAKDKSVEDLRENFEKKIKQDWFDWAREQELDLKKELFKPYLRSNTVADLASSMEIRYNPDSASYAVQQKTKTADGHTNNLSNRLISTLSKDQILKISHQLNEIYSSEAQRPSNADVSEEYVVTVNRESKLGTEPNKLKVRCNSSITKEDLIAPVMRRKQIANKSITLKQQKAADQKHTTNIEEKISTRSNSPVYLARETRGAIAAKNANVTFVQSLPTTKMPPPPPPPSLPPKTVYQTKKDSNTSKEASENISQKVQYFEERKFEEPSKTIYHAREDSSPDEEEIMRLVEENIRKRASNESNFQHKELSNSLTNLQEMFGEKHVTRVNFPIRPPPPQPPDETKSTLMPDIEETLYEEHNSSYSQDGGSAENIECYFRSRSASPQSQASSYLQRVHTGEVQKIKDKFESLGSSSSKKNNFFGVSSLRKVRSDPELCNIDSGLKDAFKTIIKFDETGDVSWIKHKFELRNKFLGSQSFNRGRSKGRKLISPVPRKDRLMPHIDIISKTAALKQDVCKKYKSPSPSPTRIIGEFVERTRCKFETNEALHASPLAGQQISHSSPDVRDIKDISPHLSASWIAHKYPKQIDNTLTPLETASQNGAVKKEKHCLKKIKQRRANSTSPPRPPKSIKHRQCTEINSVLKPYYDIFANQHFDPKKHQPKARYVPADTNTSFWSKSTLSYPGTYSSIKKTSAVKFQGLDNDVGPPTRPKLPRYRRAPLVNNENILESPNRYFESDVNIHYKTPIRYEHKDAISEEELAIRQAEHMHKLYQEERRRKYLQELKDMSSRRHTDNFVSSQKSPIPLNRYDDFQTDLAPISQNGAIYTKTVARALYNFAGQTARELSFKKGDTIYIRRQIDKNWYEGEHNAMIGLLPANYVEIISKDGVRQQQQPQKRSSHGHARAKFNFQAQSGIELSLNKGELVTLTRRVDDNWFEGKIANRKGIFPVSYVEVLSDIGSDDNNTTKTIITSNSVTNLRPSLDTMRTNINHEFNTLTQNGHQAPNGILRETKNIYKTDALHVDTNTEPIAYRSLYKYRPQNSDELELLEGDIVHVLEKCDDGWFVGTSQRTGCFGTFPGNYVERA